MGRTDRQFRVGAVVAIIHTIIFVISVNWGAIGVAKAYGVAQPILTLITIGYCYGDTHLKFRKFLQTIARPSFASISAALLIIILDGLISISIPSLPLNLLIDCVLYSLFYLILWLILPGGKRTLLEIGEILKAVKQKSQSK